MIDFSAWDTLLRRYVDDQGRVDYHAWQTEQPQALNTWLAGLAELELSAEADRPRQLAFWLNIYNACTIATVLQRYPLDSIQPQILGQPNWLAFVWFFVRPAHRIARRLLSLNQIEHGILRQQFADPRTHFALVCASLGCPLLRRGAYWPEQVDAQLDEDSRRFINNPEKVRYDSLTHTLSCSKIFQWYRADFLKIAPSIPEYIRAYRETGEFIRYAPQIAYLPYDWSLNQRKSW